MTMKSADLYAKARTILARVKFTGIFLLVMCMSNALVGTLNGALPMSALEAWGISHHSVIEGDVFRLLTGTFLSHGFGMFVRQFLFTACVIGAYEWLCGTTRAAVMFFSIDIAGSLIVLFVILPLIATCAPASKAILSTFDVGMSAGGFGLIGALIYLQRFRWMLLVFALLAICAKISVAVYVIADCAHILCLFMGFVAQMSLGKLGPDPASRGLRT